MGVLTRKENWESILATELLKSKDKAFKYGKNDCTIWSVNMLKSYSDLDWTPPWTNKQEALKFQKNNPMEVLVSKILGPPIGNLATTQRGDLVQIGTGMDSALGICIGRKVALLKQVEGICYADLSDCEYSWRI